MVTMEAKRELLEIVNTLTDALKFYANPTNYIHNVPEDKGLKARKALDVIRRKADDKVGGAS